MKLKNFSSSEYNKKSVAYGEMCGTCKISVLFYFIQFFVISLYRIPNDGDFLLFVDA